MDGSAPRQKEQDFLLFRAEEDTVPARDLHLECVLQFWLLRQDRNGHHLALERIQGIDLACPPGDIPGDGLKGCIRGEYNGNIGGRV